MQHIKRNEDFFLQKIREGILEINERGQYYKLYDERYGKDIYKRIDRVASNGYIRVHYVNG
ncbi:MAG: hypothetical protein ACYC9O_17555 [Candidatus Latescibacterota bacterium]